MPSCPGTHHPHLCAQWFYKQGEANFLFPVAPAPNVEWLVMYMVRSAEADTTFLLNST
jgi:hypothetical protein